jgi:adenylate cyclase
MIENSDSLIQSVDPEGNSFYVNRRWLETLGYTRDEASGLSFLYVIHPDCRDHCHSIFKELMNGESFSRVECDFMSRSREKLAVEGNVSCHFEKGRPIATRGFFRATRGGEGCGEISGEEPPAAEKLDGIPLEDLYLVFRDLLSGC